MTAAELTEFKLLLHVPGLTYGDLQRMDATKVERYAIYLDEVLKMREEEARRAQQYG